MTGKKADKRKRVLICSGTGCMLSGSSEIQKAFKEKLKEAGLQNKVDIILSGCHGFCSQGPIVVVYPGGIFYPMTKPEQVPRIVEEHLKNNTIIEEYLYKDPLTEKRIPEFKEINFYKKQTRIVLKNCGEIDPENIDEYIYAGGYQALKKAFSKNPEDVIEEIKASGLRGRGGAGFPTGLKWELTRKASGEPKYIICNADEGDPGAFMDRSILEGDPHSVIEGMIIAAYAIGASEGYVYVRAEYPLAVKRIRIAVEQAREKGFLGKNILSSSYSFDIKIIEGAGAFVCGEETALIASIEGKRGMPRLRPPFPANQGLWGKPTCINNVETFANVPWIINNGAEKYASLGTETSKGTKIFAVTGKVKNSGLVEVPMGTTLREVIFDICGGVKDGKDFKAVQIGGPSGGCLPAEYLDTPIDYESLAASGAIVGSGGMVVADTESCMVDLARFFLEFTQKESCGKCVPCRVGTKRMLEILNKLTSGKGIHEDIERVAQLAEVVKVSSLCGLGQTAPNPLLTTLRYFKDEYEAHIDGRCPAGVCAALTTFIINEKLCTGCGVCKKSCPVGAIVGERKEAHEIINDKCIKCGICKGKCPFDAIYKV